MNDAHRRLLAVAAAQRQVFTRAQALDAGLSFSDISKRIADTRFAIVGSRTLTFAGASLDWRGQLRAGLLDLGPGTVVAAEAAGALHELDGYREGPLVFLTTRGKRKARTVGDVLSTTSIDRLDRVRVDGLDVTSGTRTVITLLGRVDRRRLGNAYDSACRQRLTAPAVIDRRLDELGRQGRVGLEDLYAIRRAGDVESWLEREFLKAIGGSGLPRPSVQRVYRRDGVHVARVDFDFAPLPIVVEVGGRRGYLSLDERRRQERRRNDVQLLGRAVYFFTTEDVRDDKPYVVATLQQAVRAA